MSWRQTPTVDFELEISGFDTAELDVMLDEPETEPDPADGVPEPEAGTPVTKPGDIWNLGEHRLICGDARDPDIYARLMEANPPTVCSPTHPTM